MPYNFYANGFYIKKLIEQFIGIKTNWYTKVKKHLINVMRAKSSVFEWDFSYSSGKIKWTSNATQYRRDGNRIRQELDAFPTFAL